MPEGNLFEVLGHQVREASPGELMVESSPSCQRQPQCKTKKGMSDEAADAAACTYLRTSLHGVGDVHRPCNTPKGATMRNFQVDCPFLVMRVPV